MRSFGVFRSLLVDGHPSQLEKTHVVMKAGLLWYSDYLFRNLSRPFTKELWLNLGLNRLHNNLLLTLQRTGHIQKHIRSSIFNQPLKATKLKTNTQLNFSMPFDSFKICGPKQQRPRGSQCRCDLDAASL